MAGTQERVRIGPRFLIPTKSIAGTYAAGQLEGILQLPHYCGRWSARQLPGPDMVENASAAVQVGPSQFVHDEEHLQLAGCDIILICGPNETHGTRYRARKAGLAAFSSVFRDMFASSSEDNPDVGDLPVIVLDDEVSALTDLLSFIFAQRSGHRCAHVPISRHLRAPSVAVAGRQVRSHNSAEDTRGQPDVCLTLDLSLASSCS